MLQALMAYGSNLDSEPGFKTREVRWCIELAKDGSFLNVLPLGDGRRGEIQPRCPDMHGMNAGGKSHFLVETAQTIALLFKANEEEKSIARAKEKQQFFTEMLGQAAASCPELSGVVNALENPERQLEIRNALAQHGAKPTDWLGWRVEGADPRNSETVQSWWREWRKLDLGESSEANLQNPACDSMVCLLTGEQTQPLLTHPKITGLSGVGGIGMGDVMVGFDKAAFGSYGLDQSANAAIGAMVVQQYVDGLNDLVRNHSGKLANALVVHWFKERIVLEDDPLEWLNGIESEGATKASAHIAARNMLDAIRSGKRADLGNNHFYAMTISGASGRVMVRDWMEGQFENLVINVEAWFSDLAIALDANNTLAFDPKFYEVCLALVRNDRTKSISKNLEQLPAPTAATLWKVAVQRLPIPQPLMAQALARFRSDLIKDEPFNHARMGLIRAYFFRLQPGSDTAMTAYLNPEHPEPAYHCGRLLAILANLQRAALGDDVGAGVVQRYYASASQTPGLIIGRLAANARNHLGKLDNGLAWWYEEQIADVISRLGDAAPRTLDLNGQGLFALGYYQQLAKLRTGNKSNDTNQGEK